MYPTRLAWMQVIYYRLIMFIAKTVFDKKTLIALQQQIGGTVRSNDNDLVALQYVFDSEKKAHDILRDTCAFDVLIRYTFFWTLNFNQVNTYQHENVQMILQTTKDVDETPIWCCFFHANLRTWIQYCQDKSKHPTTRAFVSCVKDQLESDGYTLRLKGLYAC